MLHSRFTPQRIWNLAWSQRPSRRYIGEGGSGFIYTLVHYTQSSGEFVFSLILGKSNLETEQREDFLESNDSHYKPKAKS